MAESDGYTGSTKSTTNGARRRKMADVIGFISLVREALQAGQDNRQHKENPEEEIEKQERKRARISMEVREALMQTMYRGAIEGWFRGGWWR